MISMRYITYFLLLPAAILLIYLYKGTLTMLSDGTIIRTEKFIPHTYKSLKSSDQQNITPERYARYVDWCNTLADAQVSKITYMSDGLQVVGFLMQPTAPASQKLPVVIYNRGGSNDDGKINVTSLKNRMYPFVKAGYMVIASQYRGNDGGQGSDELGGSDVNDVLALFETIKWLPNADTNNIFMVGYSRGAMNSYCALAAGARVNAIAVVAGVADLLDFDEKRAEVRNILESMIPNLPEQREQEYKKRSVMFWPEKINVPLLLLHGDADAIVSVEQSQLLSQKLNELSKVNKLVIYPGCDHFFTQCRDACAQEVIKWFEKYKK